MGAGEKITAMDEMARLIVNYRIPAVILRDVNQRVDDWKKSISYRDDNDPYLWQQVKYLRNYLKASKQI
ncbi:hypothetical protein QUW35_02970 [Ligilactobacillus agilis]|uniref:DUF6877 family protein n=1 Tax=Ligilactobacillus agilis TaxID=1601 RepID=UPI0025A37C34|nr:DUF6877 family protein [Ligilactobacillus agilis]MDM8279655.1 hypothetical protein [Ligilactobacillus agilis]